MIPVRTVFDRKVEELQEAIPELSERHAKDLIAAGARPSQVTEFHRKGHEEKTLSLKLSTAQRVLTEKRLRILDALTRKEFDTISELSEELGRDKMEVSRDIKALYEAAIIELEESEVAEDGRSLKPVFELSQIQIQPVTFNEEGENSR